MTQSLLQLVNFAREEGGVSGAALSSLSGATGENLRFKNWAIRAWKEIQSLHADWYFMRGSFSFTTTADQGAYTSAQAGIASRFGYWDKTYCTAYLTAAGVSDQTELQWLDYEDFRSEYLTGPQTSSRPECFTIGLSNELIVGPEPVSTAYTIAGQYSKSVQVLSADDDTPEIPEQEEIIAYRALMKYAVYDAAAETFEYASKEYRRILALLRNKYLPEIKLAGPLT